MALVPFPPTSSAFLSCCTKPEAFLGNASAAGVSTATIDQALRRRADYAAAIAFGDRATLPLLTVDEGFEGAVCALAARDLMASRGYNRQAGADEEIVKLAENADAYLAGCGPGSTGKRITPMFTDSAAQAG